MISYCQNYVYITYLVGEDFTLSRTQLEFSHSEGSTRRNVYIRALNRNSEGVKTIILEVSGGDWPFITGGNRTIVTIRHCLGKSVASMHMHTTMYW